MSDDVAAGLLEHLRAQVPEGPEAWIVGGAVRDRLLGRPTDDLDLAVATADGAVVRRIARGLAARAGGQAFPLSDAYGAWRVSSTAGAASAWQVDLTPLQGADLAEDLSRRDLTVNAIAEPLAGGALVDPSGGAEDLRTGRLRAVGPSSFSSDPVRVLRLARFAAELDARPDEPTLDAARRAAPALGTDVPGERMLPELSRALTGPGWARGLDVGEATGAFAAVLPSAVGDDGRLRPDVTATLAAVLGPDVGIPGAGPQDAAALRERGASPEARLVLALAALVRHAADPRSALHPLRPSRELRSAVTRAVATAGRIASLGPAPSAMELFAALGPASSDVVDAAVFSRAVVGPAGRPWPAIAARAVRWGRDGPPRPPVTGDALAAALGIRPGPELGRLLTAVAVAHDAGEIDGEDRAVALARELHAAGAGESAGGG
ncbi:CCA tRNA nucleotidyltransferase [Patulibacter minatonensis]|uniref:CCA tRNA nucleotidyltransferase n=1 Tax=Patulibacter minatonensis TaxID=298163 RepID=UPI00047E52A7|nr:CCA tRNA nucleotidyltransferase [Patulibacter minatonensis]